MNILFVDDKNVFAPSFGAEQRSNLLLQACCKFAQVDVILLKQYNEISTIDNCQIVFQDEIDNNFSFVAKVCNKIKHLFPIGYESICLINRKKKAIIDNIISAKKYDYIVVRYVPNAISYGLLKYANRLVIDIDDNPVTLTINRLKSTHQSILKKLFWKIKLSIIKNAYSNLINSIRIPFVSNIDDTHINESKCIHLPNVPFAEPNVDYCNFSTTSKRVIWVGLVNYPPNYLGLEHFFECIYPRVLSKIPNFEVVIVGKYGDYDVSKWQKLQGVSVKGFVEDLEPEYRSARAAIVPCYSGAGTNIKVLEAMRMKRPCITSEYGARGYDKYFEKNVDYLVCKNDEEFATSIIDMLENNDNNHTICKKGFEKVSKYFSKEGFYKIVESCLKSQL
jgi:glycosyltransferase involved in cell wall biosynthesis